MIKAIIIGNGSIGTELKKQVEEIGWSVSYVFSIDKVLDSSGAVDDISNWNKYTAADIVFLAIPTDDGKTAFEYIDCFANKGIPVVTCEKGSLAYYSDRLSAHIKARKLGFSATVGGGTRMLPYLQGRIGNGASRIDSITGVLNGTLNYIFSRLSLGAGKDDVLREVLERKYAEPGANTFETIIAGETGDLHKKGVITANTFLNSTLKPKDGFHVDSNMLGIALENPKEHRFLVGISKTPHVDFLGGVEYLQDGWCMQIGLFNTKNILKTFVLPEGVNNGLYIQEGGSVFSVMGPGAGPEPTAHAMILDALDLLQ